VRASQLESAVAADAAVGNPEHDLRGGEEEQRADVVSSGDVEVVDVVVVLLGNVCGDIGPGPTLWTSLLLPFILTVIGPSVASLSYDACPMPNLASLFSSSFISFSGSYYCFWCLQTNTGVVCSLGSYFPTNFSNLAGHVDSERYFHLQCTILVFYPFIFLNSNCSTHACSPFS
jgi:hypothetical protein